MLWARSERLKPTSIAAADPVKEHRWPPCCFTREDGFFLPTGLARSPWDRGAVAGGAISGLLATAVEDLVPRDGFEIARYAVEILGKVPYGPIVTRARKLRDGRRMQLHVVELVAEDGQAVAQATVLLVGVSQAPRFPVPHDYPAPPAVPEAPWVEKATMKGSIRTRPIRGNAGVPGRGTGWMAMDCEMVAGETPSNFVKAAFLADYGAGVGSATRTREWTYLNLDITVQFLRMPVGEWLLIDAETFMEGHGHGAAFATYADELGVYARGVQTIFVAPSRRTD
jgi:hypothetical protein